MSVLQSAVISADFYCFFNFFSESLRGSIPMILLATPICFAYAEVKPGAQDRAGRGVNTS